MFGAVGWRSQWLASSSELRARVTRRGGPFFPTGLSAKRQLKYYASQFETVELNSVFYSHAYTRIRAIFSRMLIARVRLGVECSRVEADFKPGDNEISPQAPLANIELLSCSFQGVKWTSCSEPFALCASLRKPYRNACFLLFTVLRSSRS